MWHVELKDLVNSGRLQIIGIIQEQHAERCRLFAQWHGIEWPVLHDPINLVGVQAVPIFVALDADGVVRHTKPTPAWVRDTLTTKHAVPSRAVAAVVPSRPDMDLLRKSADSPASRMAVGDAEVLWNRPSAWSRAIDLWSVNSDSTPDAALLFRLGVAYRGRWDSELQQPDDFRNAVASWERALSENPNHYIYRRRIQQYGPRLTRPYPFYDWIDDAQKAIRMRGETPVEISVPLTGAETVAPSRQFSSESNSGNPDPDSRIAEDTAKRVSISYTTVPQNPPSGQPFRLHLSFKPNSTTCWNNETPPAVVWIDVPDDWSAERQRIELNQLKSPESSELRQIDLELKSPESLSGRQSLSAYILYYICEEGGGGQCLYLRQSFELKFSLRD